MVPTLISLFPFMSFCRLGRESTPPPGTGGNCSSIWRDFRRFRERFSWRDLAGGWVRGKERPWPLHTPAEGQMGGGDGRRLVYDSSEWVEELQLLVSEGNSLDVTVGKDDTWSVDGRGCDAGGGAGGGGGGGGGGAGGGSEAGRLEWKPLHFGLPFVRGRKRSNGFRVSTLSRDFVLPRFFCRMKHNRGGKLYSKIQRKKRYIYRCMSTS